jgi:hypothetical protein
MTPSLESGGVKSGKIKTQESASIEIPGHIIVHLNSAIFYNISLEDTYYFISTTPVHVYLLVPANSSHDETNQSRHTAC